MAPKDRHCRMIANRPARRCAQIALCVQFAAILAACASETPLDAVAAPPVPGSVTRGVLAATWTGRWTPYADLKTAEAGDVFDALTRLSPNQLRTTAFYATEADLIARETARSRALGRDLAEYAASVRAEAAALERAAASDAPAEQAAERARAVETKLIVTDAEIRTSRALRGAGAPTGTPEMAAWAAAGTDLVQGLDAPRAALHRVDAFTSAD